MNDTEQRIAIAKECGWSQPEKGYWQSPEGRKYQVMHGWQTYKDGTDILPDYLNDLNACAEFEAAMTPSQFSCYCDCLCDMVYDGSKDPNIEGLVKLSARQRCEAFLREKGLWK